MIGSLTAKGKLLVIISIVICFGIVGFILVDEENNIIVNKLNNVCHSCVKVNQSIIERVTTWVEGRHSSKSTKEDLEFSKDHFVSEGLTVHDTKKFFDEYLFQKGIAETSSTNSIQGKIVGAVVPHHLIPSFIIADIFECIANQGTKTIILFSPNHQDIGDTSVLTSKIAWDTPTGKILPEIDVIQKLIQKDYISIDEDVLDNEHGIAGLLPFVTHYDSDIRVVPLILRRNITREQIQDLSQSLASMVDDKTVVVASVDFSHYLNSMQAEENDIDTLKAMKEKNYDKLLQMNSNHLDSPEAITVLLQIMEQLNIKSSEILHHTNSGRLMDEPFAETTSYFGMIFTK